MTKTKRLLLMMVLAGAIRAPADVTTVQIRAVSDFEYGVDAVATMVSDVLTAEDGLATYQIAFDVTPPSGRSIRSGITGIIAGTATNWSWGVGPEDTIFSGNHDDGVEDIGNLRITNFNANGGSQRIADLPVLSFASVTIANGQTTPNDAITLVVKCSVSLKRWTKRVSGNVR